MLFRRKTAFLLALMLLFVFSMSACSAPAEAPSGSASKGDETSSASEETASATPDATTEPTPEPTLPPAPTDEEVIAQMGKTDIFTYIPEDTYATEEGQRWYEPVIEKEEVTLSLPEKYETWLTAASDALSFDGVSRIEKEFEPPAWPMLAAIVANYRGDPEGMRQALIQAGGISTRTEETPDGYVLHISAHPTDPNTLFLELPESDVTNSFSLVVSYAYLATVFDESLHGREGIGEPELEQLLFPIAMPDRWFVGDCWYQARDGGARLHTGTDMNAPEGTDLLACVDGTIILNGQDSVAGNYIVLQGADGTQYHYYHMVVPSDVPVGTAVKRGDVIGHVGCTGNSRANHLHFTIVTSDGYYVNPFRYLQRAQTDTITGAVTAAPAEEVPADSGTPQSPEAAEILPGAQSAEEQAVPETSADAAAA